MSDTNPDEQPVLPSEVAECLGVAVGESLVCEPDEETADRFRRVWANARWAIAASVVSVSACAAVVPMTFFAPAWLAVAAGLFGVGLLAASLRFCVRADRRLRSPECVGANCRVEADAYGLRASLLAGRTQVELTWPEIDDLGAVYGDVRADGCRDVVAWRVETTRQVLGAPTRVGTYAVPGAPRRVTICFRADAPNADRIAAAARHLVEARRLGRPLWDPSAVPDGGLSRMTSAESPTPGALSLSSDATGTEERAGG